MNLEEMSKRLGLSEVKHIESYMEKAEKSEIKYCDSHDREYYDFEFGGMCPICREEKLFWDYEHGDVEAGKILEKNGRLGEED